MMGSRLEGLARYSDGMSAAIQSAVEDFAVSGLDRCIEELYATVVEVGSTKSSSNRWRYIGSDGYGWIGRTRDG